jgi:flagellar biogenesis protein FliO
MDAPERHRAIDYSHLAAHVAALIFVIFFAVLVVWLVASKPNAKLFEDTNYVCYSQPLQMECAPRGK